MAYDQGLPRRTFVSKVTVRRPPECPNPAVRATKTGALTCCNRPYPRHHHTGRRRLAPQTLKLLGGCCGDHLEIVATGEHGLQKGRLRCDGPARCRRERDVAGRYFGGDA